MRRFYVPRENISHLKIRFTKEESHHITHVLRMHPGEKIEIFDGAGDEYCCQLTAIGNPVEAKVIEKINTSAESPIKIALAQALTKFDKFEFVVQKATELGIFELYPVISERTEIKLSPQKASLKVERWQRIALEAAKQARRSMVPVVKPVEALSSFLTRAPQVPGKLKVMLTEHHGLGLKQILNRSRASSISVLVGPEGGWSEKDLESAAAGAYQFVSLGHRILRTETAGLVVAAIIQYELGDLG